MSEKDETSKRLRQHTDADVRSLLEEIKERKERIEELEQYINVRERVYDELKKTLEKIKQDLSESQVEKKKLNEYVRELIQAQKTFAKQLSNIQETLQVVLAKQNRKSS